MLILKYSSLVESAHSPEELRKKKQSGELIEN
jgi:hypothetical protein